MRKFKFWMAVLTALVLVFSGCQIGLGDAVDTRTPSIAVTQPSVGDVVRDKFELKGTWGDDGEIKSLDISLKRVDIEDAVPINYSAKWEKTDEAENEHLGVWSTLIDPKQDEVKDGKYEATATIKDKAGHSYAVTRTFIIDNTPPVVVLQRPSAKGTSTMADSYGQLFTLEGQSADDNNIDLIEMYIYKDADLKEKAHTISLKNVPPTISLDVAQFGEDDYTSIYGSTEKNGEVARYCTIMAYDSAVRYPLEGEQSDEDKKGNCTDIYYLYDEVSADVLSENKITEVYQMMSGNYTADRAAATIEKVSEVLRAHEVKIGYFTLNPENNPTFTVNGKDPLKKDGTDFASEDNKITTGSNVVIEIAPGLDGIILDETTLKIKITQCDANGKKLDGATPYYPETTYKKSGTTYKFTVKLTKNPEKGFVLGQNYIIEAEGKDIGGNPVFPSNPNGYGFRLSSGGGAPVLSIESPAEGTTYLKKGSDVEVKGNVVVQEGTPDITFYINNELIKTITLDPADAIDDNGKFKFLFNYTVLAENFAQDESKEYTLKVMAAGEDSSVDKEKQISYDVDGPVLGFNEVSPIVDVLIGSETKECVNDKLLIRVSASDAYTKIKDNATKWQIEQDGEVKKSGTFGKDNSVTIDTKEAVFTDEKAAKIVISSEDVAGNTNTLTKDIYISQKTDIPVITSTNTTTLSFDVKEESSLATATTNKIAKGGILQISAKDDDGIQATYIDIFDNTGKSIFDVKNDGKYDPYSTAASTIVYTMPDEKVGHFRVVIYAEDINGYTTKGTADQKEFWIRVTGNQPTINLDKTSTWISSSYIGQIPVTISVTNEDSEFYNFYKGVIEGSNVEPTYTLLEKVPVSSSITTDYTYNFTKNDIAPGTTSQDYIYFMVEDSNGIRSGAKQFKYQIDNQAPYSDITTPGSESTATNALSQVSYSFTGTAQDGTGSQVKAIWYKVLDKAVTAPTAPSGDSLADGTWTAAGWTKASNTDSWNFTQKFKAKDLAGDALVEGSYTAYVFAVDNAGNIGTISNRLFDVDLTAPELTVTQTQTEINASKNYSFTLSGTAGDTQELDYVLIQFDENDDYKYATKAEKDSESAARITNSSNTLTLNTKALDGSSTTVEAAGIAWSITFAESGTGTYQLPNGRHKVTIKAVDKMGRESAAVTKTVNVDTTPPEVSVTTPASNVFSKTSTYRFEGTAKDEGLGLKSVKVQLYNGSNVAQGEAEEVNVSNDKWSYPATNLADAAGYYVLVTAIDEGDNPTTSTKGYTVTVDTTPPTTNLTGTSLDATTLASGSTYYTSTGYGLSGTITDANIKSAKYKIDDGAENNITLDNKNWSLTSLSGSHKYTILLEDQAGNKNDFNVTVKVDADAPTVSIKIPAEDITDPNLAINDDEYSFRINATDGSGVGVKELKYGFSTSSTTEPASWVTDDNFADGDKYFTIPVIEGRTAQEGKLSEGNWYLWTQAKDKSGNTSTYAKRALIVDKEYPELKVTQSLNETGTNALYSEVTSTGYTISGTVSDSNAMASSAAVVVKVDGVTKLSTTNASWSCTIPKGDAAGTLLSDAFTQVEITATDIVGKTTTKKYTLYYDTKAPELEVSSPVTDEQVETAKKVIKGTVSDEGYGLAKLEFELRNSSGTVVKDSNGKDIKGDSTGAGNYPITIKGEQWYYANNTNAATDIPLGTTEGALKLYVKATENASASRTTEKTIDFYYDKANPVIEETGIGTTGKTTNSNYTFTGTAYDTNALAKIEIKEGSTVVATTEGTTPTITCPNMASAKADASKATWTATIAASGVSDGIHTYTVAATDISGKTTTLTRVVTVDKTAPSISSSNVSTAGATYNSQTWYGSRSISVSVTASDNTGGSGVSVVEYAIGSNADTATWKPLANTGSAFEGSITFTADGANTYYVRAKDVAGNYTAVANRTAKTVYIDSVAPAQAVLSQVDGKSLSGSKLTNKTADITFTFTQTDATTAISSVKLVKVGSTTLTSPINATNTSGTYSITLPKANIENGGVTVQATDSVGNTTDTTLFQITVDNTAPTAEISVIPDADSSVNGTQVNGIISITGTANDNNTLDTVKLQKSTDNSTWTDTGLTNEGSVYSWKFTVDTTTYTDNTTEYFRVVVTDTAGNTGYSASTVVKIAQDSDRPVIKLSGLKLDTSSAVSGATGYYWLKDSTLYGDVTDDDGTVKSVKYKIGSSGTLSGNIYYNGLWTISGLTDGNQDIYFVVEDANGTTFTSNTASTTLGSFGPKIKDSSNEEKLGYSSSANDILKLKVDVTDPTITDLKYYVSSSATVATSPTWITSIDSLATTASGGTNKYVFITYTASDTNGIDTDATVIKFANNTATTSTTNVTLLENNVIRIDTSAFSSGSSNLDITVKDNAGRTASITKTVSIDKDAPTVTLNNFTDADTSTTDVEVNGVISASGTANDNNELASVQLEYKKSSDTTWTAYGTALTENLTSWTVSNIDTTSLTDETKYDIRIKAVDKVGNIGYSAPKTVKVSQATDKPKIRITNISFEGVATATPWLKNVNTLYGIVTDDDGNVKSLQYRIGDTGDFTTIASAATSGSFELGNIPDGTQKIYFKVQDAAQTGTTVHEDCVITDGTTVSSTTILTLKVDKNLPAITEVKYSYYDSKSSETEDAKKWKTYNQTVPTVGGNYTKLKVQFKASDANAIQTVAGTFDGTNITFTCEDTDYSDSGDHVWTSNEITIPTNKGTTDIEMLALEVTVTDGAGLANQLSIKIPVDNATPNFTFTSPSSDGSTLYGVISNTLGGNSTSSDIVKREFVLTKTAATDSTTGWNEITGDNAISTITLVFDGTTGNDAGYHTKLLRTYMEELYDDKTPEEHNEDDTNKEMYVNVRITDSCGNSSIISRQIYVIPNGDKPQVTIDYPESDGGSLAGSIRLNGTSQAALGGIKAVYVQIDTNYNGTTFTSDWETGFNSKIEGKGTTYKSVAQIGNLSGEKGIPANGTQNWNLTINTRKEFNPPTNIGVTNMAIKVYAVSNSNKASDPVIRVFNIDPNAPRFGGTDDGRKPLELIQKDSSGNVTARIPYTSEMWVKGDWYLVGSVSDDGGIKELTLDNGNTVQTIIGEGSLKVTNYAEVNSNIPGGDATYKNWDMCIPLATGTSSGKLSYTLEATEGGGTDGSTKEVIIINFDNTPPNIALNTHDQYSIPPRVEQSNGFYTLKSFASDTDSGMSRVAFYFLRRTTSGSKVYDPMINNEDISTSDTGVVYSEGLYWKQKNVTISDDQITLSAKDDNIHIGTLVQVSGSLYKVKEISDDGKTLTLNTPASTATTAKFALALVVDNMEKKESASGKIQTDEGYGEGYYEAPANDDGDRMVEVWDGTSASGQWQAQINSANIPDGPIEIHYVVFDKSLNYSVGIVGNVDWTTYSAYTTADAIESKSLNTKNTNDTTAGVASHFTYSYGGSGNEAYVSNNAPRLVGVTFGCDYTGDGVIDATEKQTRYYSTANRFVGGVAVKEPDNYTNKWISSSDNTENGDAWAVVKDMSSVQFEIVGGNGDLFYEWQLDNSYADIDGSSHIKTEQNSTSFDSIDSTVNLARQTKKDENGLEYYEPKELDPIYLGRKLKTGETDKYELDTSLFGTGTGKLPDCGKANDEAKWWTIKVWDSTENTTKFVNSQYAMLVLPISVQIQDTIAPRTVFNDLYWKSSTENSVYKDPSTDAFLGHIELKDDLYTLDTDGVTKIAKNSTMESTYGIDDDKVSGKVVFSGYAYDNKRLGSLRWGIASTKGDITNNQAWPQQYVTSVNYTDGTWSTVGNTSIDNPFYYFKVYNDSDHNAYLNGDGHKVYWELVVDTSRVQDKGKADDDAWAVGKDLYVWVQASDAAATPNTSDMNPAAEVTDGTDEENIRPNYKVDVVPYVTGIKSILKENRSSTGRYQISSTETGVELIGYNLKVNNANLPVTISSSGTYTGDAIHGCPIINNINDNAACGKFDTTGAAQSKIATNGYNYQPTSYNYTLTDDIVIDLWNVNPNAARTNGTVGYVREPIVRYNPNNGNIGMAFSNGASRFSMPNGTTTSNTVWERNYASYVANAMIFDSKGVSYGVSTGIDTEPSSGKAGRMNLFCSSWGTSYTNDQTGNFNDNTNSIHLDSIGLGEEAIIEQRFSSTTLALAEHTANNKTDNVLYMAYYDMMKNRIVFKYGHISTKANTNKAASGQLVNAGTGNSGFDIDNVANGAYISLLADESITPNLPGEYVDITVISDGASSDNDVVCAVWYNGSSLMYSYKINPCNDNDASSTNTGSGYWSAAQILIERGGQYCKIEADKNGGIHIAAFDQANLAVGYIYLPTYNTTYNKDTHYYIIDASNGPYDEIGLDVAVDAVGNNGKAYPTISYYANGSAKMARCINGVQKSSSTNTYMPEQSWEDNAFTGNWDVCFIPTQSALLKDHICIALPKNGSGVIGTTNTTGNSFMTNNTGSGATTSSTVKDNQTVNPIIGYAIRRGSAGFMELAQRVNSN